MTVLITAEEARKLVVELRTSDALEDGGLDACELGNKAADMIEALHQQLADAKAAQGLVVERAADMIEDNVRHAKELGREIWAMPDLRALADTDGMALLAELRAERDKWRGIASDNGRGAMDNLAAITALEADRDRLAAANAALEEKVRGLVEALANAVGALDGAGEHLSELSSVLSRDPWEANQAYQSARDAQDALAAMQPAAGEQG